jgi:STE24 endopeptidase
MFQLTIAVILIVFGLEVTLSMLNYQHRNQPVPENVADVYRAEDYKKWLSYTMETHRLSLMVKILNTAVLILFFILDIFPALSRISGTITPDPALQTLLFLGLYAIISYFIRIGFRLYRIFSIETRYGFNKYTVKTFLLDQLKSLFLALMIGGGILYPAVSLYQQAGNMFLLYVWPFIILLLLIMNVLYTKVLIRIFNKLTPLPEGDLHKKIEALARAVGYEIRQISIMDASKRSSRLNAFFSGFGRFRHIVLFDTLVEKCSDDEVVSVLAHEIGHAKHRDVLRFFALSILEISAFLALFYYFLSSTEIAHAFGFSEVHLGFAIILFSILISPLGILLGIPVAALSRKAEFKADAFAAEAGYRKAMISALKVLARENFANLTPHPVVVKLTYSHPPVSQRIAALSLLRGPA